MKVHIDPQYEQLRGEIMKVVAGDYVASKVYCHKRNVVEKVCMQGKEYVVKTYKRPNLFNRLVYTYLRKTKAKRAFLNAQHLLELDIETPTPVAYIEIYRKGLFSKGYFISEYVPYHTIRETFDGKTPESNDHNLKTEFMRFALALHEKKVLPLDFNSGNIFYYFDTEKGCYRFALTDINRMQFGKTPSTYAVMRSFEQLGVPVDGLYKLALYYSSQKGSDLEYSMFIFLFHRLRSRIKRFLKRKAKAKR